MRKKLLTMLLTASLAAGLLAGCGEKEENSKANTTESSEENASATEQDEVTITLSHWGSETDEKTYRERADLYEASHPGVKIEINYIPTDYIQKMNTMFAGGTAPDIAVFAEEIHSFSSKGMLLPLDDYVKEAGIDVAGRVGQAMADAYSYNGNLYGIADRGGSMVLYYNKDMFDAAGIEYPTSDWEWDDMLKASIAMTGGSGEDEHWGYATENWWAYWMTWIYQAGGRVIDENGNLAINSPESVKGLKFLQELTTKYDVMPTREEYANMGSGAYAGSVFAQGKVGMVPCGLWMLSSLQDVDFEYGIVEMFGGPEKVTAPFSNAMTISSTCKHPDIAFDIINFMTDIEAQEIIVKNLEDAPANLEVLGSDTFKNAGWGSSQVDMGVFERSSKMLFSVPLNPNWTSWDTIMNDEMAGVFDGTVDPQTALDNIQKRIEQQ